MRYFITNLSFSLLLKEFLKSVNIWQDSRSQDQSVSSLPRRPSDEKSGSHFATSASQ